MKENNMNLILVIDIIVLAQTHWKSVAWGYRAIISIN